MNRSIDPPPLPVFPPPLPNSLVVDRELSLAAPVRGSLGDSFSLPPPLPTPYDVESTPPPLPRRRSRNEFQMLVAGIEWIFGLFCLIVALAILAALPILQFLSLGYLLEAGGRVAKSGRFRDGFIGIRAIARVGGIVLTSWLLLWPIRFLADFVQSATIIDPDGKAAKGWQFGLYVAMTLVFAHIALACAAAASCAISFGRSMLFGSFAACFVAGTTPRLVTRCGTSRWTSVCRTISGSDSAALPLASRGWQFPYRCSRSGIPNCPRRH